MDSPDAEDRLRLLQELPPSALDAYISSEDSRLSVLLMARSDDIHAAMAAWHSLGTAETVRTLFRQLEDHLTGIAGKRDGGLRSRIRDFFSESEPGIPEHVLSGLEGANGAATTYQQRMTALAEAHGAALESYKAWISALTRLAAAASAGEALLHIVRRSAETISAQQQLAGAARLQLNNIRLMSADVGQITSMARSLAMNMNTAKKMHEQQYRQDVSRLLGLIGNGQA